MDRIIAEADRFELWRPTWVFCSAVRLLGLPGEGGRGDQVSSCSFLEKPQP